mmetsp:Transcript_18368/g.32516  ORF Transcript_18368/g.32516 Transcript_18368/m.32516 type:complete len:603 (-) Transcript_18368:85-1893(-)
MVKHPRRNGGSSNTSSNPDRKNVKGDSNFRTKATIKRLNMYKSGAPIRNREGKIIGGDLLSRYTTGNKAMERMARIAPNRKWFGNTRTIGQKQLEEFRDQMTEKVADPYTVVLNQRKLPMGLLTESTKVAQMNLLSAESFEKTFGPKKQRKRANIGISSLEAMVQRAETKAETHALKPEEREAMGIDMREDVFAKGQSKRIWQELYKVLDCSDVVVQVLDARDPLGTRSKRVEQHLTKDKKHKHLIFVLNKCDLVPTWVTKRWVRILSEEFPTLAFHAHLNKPFGKGALIQLLRQFALLHPEKKNISVGMIGYPNAGKSSIINTLRSKNVCKVAPIPGQTKVWQYVTLFKRVFLIDCPGVVYPNSDSEAEIVMKGVVRAERLESPEDYIGAVLERVSKNYIQRIYGIMEWDSPEDFLTQLCHKRGRLLRKGEPDFRSVSQGVIYDMQRGRLPYFVPPPAIEGDEAQPEENTREVDGLGAIPQQDLDQLPQTDFAAVMSKGEVESEEEEENEVEEDNSDPELLGDESEEEKEKEEEKPRSKRRRRGGRKQAEINAKRAKQGKGPLVKAKKVAAKRVTGPNKGKSAASKSASAKPTVRWEDLDI